MSVRPDELYTQFIEIAEATISLAEAVEQLPAQYQDFYVVIHLAHERFICLQAVHLKEAFQALTKLNEKRKIANTSLAALFAGMDYPAAHLDDPGLQIYLRPWAASPTGALVVLSAGEVVGVLPPMTPFRSGSDLVYGESALRPAKQEAQPVKEFDVKTFDGSTPYDHKRKPLELGRTYTIKLSLKDTLWLPSDVQKAIFKYLWQSGEQSVTLTVLVQSADFDCPSESFTLVVPRQGDSETLQFAVRPRNEGRCELNILFYKGETFIQLLTLTYTVGELFKKDASGRVMEAAFMVKPRSLNLTILESRGGFQVIMSRGGQKIVATLPLTKNDLDIKIREMRRVLREKVVFQRDAQDKPIYTKTIQLDPQYRQQGLSVLAEVGYQTYRALFFSDNPDLDEEKRHALAQLGETFYQLARGGQPLSIQIFSQHFMLPWGILYIARPEEFDPGQVHPEWFLGFSHIIEHIPLWQSRQMQSTDTIMDTRDGLTVSLNVNPIIDQELRAPLVASQTEYWRALEHSGKVKLVMRDNPQALLDAMKETSSTEDEVVYFYVHAKSIGWSEGGPGLSALIFAPNASLTLETLHKKAPYTNLLPGEPLVFINACETAELSPLFYDGFVPYFLAKGARGVIGTETEIPAIFASEWARRFFERFLAGEPVGSVVLHLRKEFLEQENNILGLLYALYVDADTHLEPGII